MVKNNSEIDIELIRKKALSKLSVDEESQLDRWLSEHKDHKMYFDKAFYYFKNQSVHDVSNLQTQSKWFNLLPQLKRTRSYKIIHIASVAASVAVLLGLMLGFLKIFDHLETKPTIGETMQVIKPGHHTAELVLSNGKTVRLGQGERQIREENGVLINSASKEVIYSADIDQELGVDLINSIRVDRGEEYSLVLSDGTRVWINSMTELQFPVSFTGATRQVDILYGEACFEVKNDKQKPFIVKTPVHNIQVMGTTFNVSCYDNDKTIETTLVEGIVQINHIAGQNKTVTINPDQQFIYTKSSKMLSVKKVNASNYTAWMKGRFVFEEESLEHLFHKLERWYDIEVLFESDDRRYETYSGSLPRFENVDVILKMIEKTSNVEIELEDSLVTIK